jgi:sulfotransferase family protein
VSAAPLPTVGYIGGIGRSGSTLLETIAACFAEVCVLGEIVHLWERGVRADHLCSCGQPFSRCPFWQRVGEVAFGGWRLADADEMRRLWSLVDRTRRIPAAVRARPDTAHAAAAREYTDRFAAIYAAAAEITGASVVVDSSKHASTAYLLRGRDDLDLRVLHMVRDSRGVAYSWTKEVAQQVADGNVVYMHRYPPHVAAALWDAQNLAFAAMARTATPVWRLRYEDLLADPVPTARTLASFLGLPADGITGFLSDTEVHLPETHQISGNPMRFNSGTLTLRRDDAWRTQFPAADRRLVTALTAPLLRRYRYLGGADR